MCRRKGNKDKEVEIRCCYKCESREVGCHAYCKTYIEERKEHEREHEEIVNKRYLEGQLHRQTRDGVKRMVSRSRKVH